MSRLYARLQRARLAAEAAAAVAEAVRERRIPIRGRSAALDPRTLRGIPMIGGAGGAIPGTLPHRSHRAESWSGR